MLKPVVPGCLCLVLDDGALAARFKPLIGTSVTAISLVNFGQEVLAANGNKSRCDRRAWVVESDLTKRLKSKACAGLVVAESCLLRIDPDDEIAPPETERSREAEA